MKILIIAQMKQRVYLTNVLIRIKKEKGHIWDRIKSVLKDKIVDLNNIEVKSGEKIIFKAKSKGKTLFPILVEIKHV